MDKIISVEHLKKYYGEVKAVDDVSFYVEQGRLFAFLGTNGAGKSTTIDMLCTLLRPDSGTVTIDGFELGREDEGIRSSIGVVFQQSLLDPILTVRENLEIRAGFYGLKGRAAREAAKKAAEAVAAGEYFNRRYGELSGGQRRRADIARALINTPKILFLDEPTTGLDPRTRRDVWETISRLQSQSGMTVFLTTHYLEEASDADYVIIIDGGKIAARGTPDELRRDYTTDHLHIEPADAQRLSAGLTARGSDFESRNGVIHVRVGDSMEALALLRELEDSVESFEVVHGTMDDAFLTITGKEIHND